MQVLDYLGDKNGSRIEMERYKRVLKDFFSKPIGRSSYSIVELIHMSYPYNDENRSRLGFLKPSKIRRLATFALLGNTHGYTLKFKSEVSEVHSEVWRSIE